MIQNRQPLVSVIITTYNRADRVFECLEAVLRQTYQNFEVIVIDDCSNDATHERFSRYSNPKVTYVRHEKNRKVSAATNTGFRHSAGTYIAAIGDDDVWTDTRKLEKQVEIFENDLKRCYGIVTCGVNLITDNGTIQKRVVHPKDLVEHILATNGIIYGSAALVRRDVWEEVGGFDERQKKGTDSDFYRRIILRGYDVHFMNDIMVSYNALNEGRMTTLRGKEDYIENWQVYRYIIEKYKPHLVAHKKAFAVRQNQLASTHFALFATTRHISHLFHALYHVGYSLVISPCVGVSLVFRFLGRSNGCDGEVRNDVV